MSQRKKKRKSASRPEWGQMMIAETDHDVPRVQVVPTKERD